MVGCETAAFLGEQNHDVTVIEFRDKVGADVISEHRKFLMEDFQKYNIKTITGAKVTKFFEGGVKYSLSEDKADKIDGFDSVVLAMGSRAYDPLSEEVKKTIKETYVIGDAVKARRALDATTEAFEVAIKL